VILAKNYGFKKLIIELCLKGKIVERNSLKEKSEAQEILEHSQKSD